MALNFNEVLEKLGLEQDQLRKYVREGTIQAYRTKTEGGANRICFKDEDVENLYRQLRGGAGAEAASEEIDLHDTGDKTIDLSMPDGGGAETIEVEAETPPVVSGVAEEAVGEEMTFDVDTEESAGGEVEPAAAPAENEASAAEPALDVGDASETISFDLDSKDGGLSLPDDTLTLAEDARDTATSLEGTGTDLGIDDNLGGGSKSRVIAAMPATPVTKIVNEPNIHFVWAALSIMTFLVVVFLGFVSFGIVRVEGSEVSGLVDEGFYASIRDFVKNNLYFPDK